MAYGTILQQGKFTSDGNSKILRLRSDIDWMQVYNYTEMAATNNLGVQYYWQKGMGNNAGLIYSKSGGGNALEVDVIGSAGFAVLDSSGPEFAPSVAIVSSTNVTRPVFTVASTAAFATGDILNIYGVVGQEELNGMEFEVEVIDGTTFRPRYALATAPGAVGAGGYYRVRLYQPMFSPQKYLIINISSAANAVITVSKSHSLVVGDYVRLSFDGEIWGDFVSWNKLNAKVLAVTASTFTVNLDSTLLDAFAYPLPANVPYSFAEAGLIGVTSNSVDQAGQNSGYIAMKLYAGNDEPAGNANDIIYWVAGNSVSVDNE